MDLLLPTWWHWAGAIACALIVGAAKTGIPGLGFLAVPLLAVTLRPNESLSVGMLLPMLCAADVMAVWLYRRNPAIHHLWHLLPWVLPGMFLGACILAYMPNASLGPAIGGIVLVMILVHLWRNWRKHSEPPGRIAGAGFGVTAGVTTTVANAAGPIMSIYLLAQRMPKEEFIAAGAWFFFVVNLLKLPIYWIMPHFGTHKLLISADTLLIDACLLPAVVLGSLVGRRVVPHIPQRAFELVVLLLAAAASVSMLRPLLP